MTSKFKALTESTPQSSSAESIGVLAQQSKQSASSDNTPVSTPITRKRSTDMLSDEGSALTTPRQHPKLTEKSRQHAVIARVALLQLEKAGLVKRFKVLSEDGKTVREIRIVFDPVVWTPDLHLVLSEPDNTGAAVPAESET